MLQKYFPYVVIATVASTLLLIFIGGLVRAAGAGLGCPDWPMCFGMLIPPTSADALPPGYDPEAFNVVHTWTEFVNRLFGALVGLLSLVTAVFSLSFWEKDKSVTLVSWLVLIMVLFQAWLGGQVVLSALEQSMISIHMFMAMLIFATLVFLGWKTLGERYIFNLTTKQKRTILFLAVPLVLAAAVQILLGSQVREALGDVDQSLERSGWLEQVGIIDEIHRTFSWVVLLLSGGIVYYVKRNKITGGVRKLSYLTLGLVLLQILIGVVLAYGGLPRSFQVLHLGISSTLLIPMFILVLIGWRKTEPGDARHKS